ncbi:MAG: hypothetical protein V9H26_06605 [Verrucomicrobiota bacterium]|nr:hypothetical protein [Limisphaerales bacterium]
MGLLGSIFGKGKEQPTANSIRETLFGDRPLDEWPPANLDANEFPWIAFASARSHLAGGNQTAAIDCWEQIVGTPDLEPRQYLQAWHFLRQNGKEPAPDIAKQVLGVVVEVGMPKGLDLLAAYSDHSARYYNFSGAGVVWERPDDSLDSSIDQLHAAAKVIVDKIGPWKESRPAPPSSDQARLCFLTPSGLHFGQAPMSVMSSDPMAGRVLQFATVLMKALIAKTNKSTST